MGKAQKLSVTVDSDVLAEIRALAPELKVSFLVDDALKQKLTRLRAIALLDEWERESPISDEERRIGDRLWEESVSFWTQEPSPRSRIGGDESSNTSGARSKRARKSPSRPS
jgi:post-segregation antitoxin (ccd killing protein)